MAVAASRDLRNKTRALLDRVDSGESITITVDGRPVAELRPLQRRAQWISAREFIRTVLKQQTDPGLTDDLKLLAPDTTDDLD